MKTKICDGCGREGKLWKAKTKTQLGLCKSCAMKNATPIGSYKMTTKTVVDTMVDEINDFNIYTIKANNKQYKSIPELIKLATIVFNKWIRKRDTINGRSFVCICCNNPFSSTDMDAAHYMSAGSYSVTRFNEDNVHGCCIYCNRFLEGNLIEYRVNLINKIGKTKVELLEMTPRYGHKWDREELLDVIKKYK